jgi:hypothetical protein
MNYGGEKTEADRKERRELRNFTRTKALIGGRFPIKAKTFKLSRFGTI